MNKTPQIGNTRVCVVPTKKAEETGDGQPLSNEILVETRSARDPTGAPAIHAAKEPFPSGLASAPSAAVSRVPSKMVDSFRKSFHDFRMLHEGAKVDKRESSRRAQESERSIRTRLLTQSSDAGDSDEATPRPLIFAEEPGKLCPLAKRKS